MKNFLLFFIISLSLSANAQTKILDSKVDWSNGTLAIYVTDSLASSVLVQLGTEFQTYDVFNETALSIGTESPTSDTFIIPLSNVSAGVYYVDVKITSPSGIQEMEFQTSN